MEIIIIIKLNCKIFYIVNSVTIDIIIIELVIRWCQTKSPSAFRTLHPNCNLVSQLIAGMTS